MSLANEIESLKTYSCGDRCVLSVYLNTNPADPDNLKGAWKIHLKSGLKRIREYLEASEDENEIKNFDLLTKKVTEEIQENQHELRKSVVIFASADDELWSVHYVQVQVKTSFHFENHPVVEPFEYMYKAYPEAGIIMPSLGEVRILDTAMGAVKSDMTYKFDPVQEVWQEEKKKNKADQSVIGQSRISVLESTLKLNINSFFKGMSMNVDQLKKKRGWREFHVAGEAEMANAFAESIRDVPASCIHKNLNNSKPQDVVHQVFEK